ncbi:SGNH/GDSL hydrolase family protein [Halalkalibacter alkalisediminis]|uniref:SGNH/GDSL hydrolase family protein n=1 Tax=Halalkalibacter alkalisediminis TaxID=935616 RepID=A0ABV6NEQ3_9BACI|nr:SGNH/GDSL hydrolase family protein [Halalkalibacter alkalisediminis]
MKNILYYSTIIVSVAAIIVGYGHYQSKIASTVVEAQTALTSDESDNETRQTDNQQKVGGLIEDLIKKKNEKDEISLTVLGSSSLSSVKYAESWPKLLAADLQPLLPEHDFLLTVVDVDKATSEVVLEARYLETVINSKPDLLVVEPFIHNDFNQVSFKDSINHIDKIMKKLQKELPDTKIIFMPTSPIPDDDEFQEYVQDLKTALLDHNYTYADHWNSWPSQDDKKIETYIQNNKPNKKGHELLAEFMRDYLIK